MNEKDLKKEIDDTRAWWNEVNKKVMEADTKIQQYMPTGEISIHHWIAAVIHALTKSVPWWFDLQSFKIAMYQTAALCMRACQWADDSIEKRAAAIAIITMQAGAENVKAVVIEETNRKLKAAGLPAIEIREDLPDNTIVLSCDIDQFPVLVDLYKEKDKD